MSLASSKTTLTLDRAEALVLFELLAESDGGTSLSPRTPAEKLAVERLQGALESELVEPLMPEYRALVDRARSDLNNQANSAEATAA